MMTELLTFYAMTSTVIAAVAAYFGSDETGVSLWFWFWPVPVILFALAVVFVLPGFILKPIFGSGKDGNS